MPTPPLGRSWQTKTEDQVSILCLLFSVHGCTTTMRLRAERNPPTFLPLFVPHLLLSPLQESDYDVHRDSSPILLTQA